MISYRSMWNILQDKVFSYHHLPQKWTEALGFGFDLAQGHLDAVYWCDYFNCIVEAQQLTSISTGLHMQAAMLYLALQAVANHLSHFYT